MKKDSKIQEKRVREREGSERVKRDKNEQINGERQSEKKTRD